MNTMTDREVVQGWKQVKKLAAKEPVRVHDKNGGADVYVVSSVEYDELNTARILEAMRKNSNYAKSQGLTEAKLKELFPNDDF